MSGSGGFAKDRDAGDNTAGDEALEALGQGTWTNYMSSTEKIHVRVLCSGFGDEADTDPKEVKIELTSDDDIFFHYVCM